MSDDKDVESIRASFRKYIAEGYSRYRAVELTAKDYSLTMRHAGSLLRRGAVKRKTDKDQLTLF